MEDSFGRLLDLIILMVVALIIPVATVSSIADREAGVYTKKIGREFLTKIESFGVVRQKDLDRLEERIDGAGEGMVVRLSKKTLLFCPERDNLMMRNGRIGEEDVIRFYRQTESSKLEEMLAAEGEIDFDRGDVVRLEILGRGGREPVFEGETTVLAFSSDEEDGEKPAE